MQLLNGKHKHYNTGDNNGGLVRTSTIKQGFSPHDDSVSQPIRLTLLQNLDSMVHGWSDTEKSSGRRLVKFTFIYTLTNEIRIDFKAVSREKYVSGEPIISCIFWEERGQYIVTSVDIILLLEHIVKDSFGVKEKNRIRRNLQSLKPQTVSRSNRLIQRFFNLLMGMENPRPRNIEKDLKVFKWTDLFKALTKVMSKYSRNSSESADTMETQTSQQTTNSVAPSYLVNGYQSDLTNASKKEVPGQFIARNGTDSLTSSDVPTSGLNDINSKSSVVNGDESGLYTESSSLSESETHNGGSNSKSAESLQAYSSSVPSFTMTPYHNSSTSITSNAQSSDNSRSDSQELETSTPGRSKKKKRRRMKDKKNKKRAITTYIQDQSDRILGTPPAKNDNTMNAGSNGNYFRYPATSQLYINMNGVTPNLKPDITRNNMYHPHTQLLNDISVEGKVQLPPILSNHYKTMGSNYRSMDSSVDAVQKRSLNKAFANITNDEHSHLHTS